MIHRPIQSVRSIVSCLFVFVAAAAVRSDASDPLAALPTEIGGVEVEVPDPSMPDGLDATAQNSVLKEVAGKYPLERFVKDSIVAPFTLKRETIRNEQGQRVGHQVDVWFVAHGPLDAIDEEDVFFAMLDTGEKDTLRDSNRLGKEELSKRGLDEDRDSKIAYYRYSAPVLKKVVVEGVIRRQSDSSDESRLTSVALEPAFDEDDEFPNSWRRFESETTIPYRGYGGYAKVTRLADYDGALLIECHTVVHEPEGWFDGANLLGSKLPLAVQNTVRRIRRALAKQR